LRDRDTLRETEIKDPATDRDRETERHTEREKGVEGRGEEA
jgi:hypothetical protein